MAPAAQGLILICYELQICGKVAFNLYNAEIFLHKSWRPNGFEIIINVLVGSFRFILLFTCGDQL